MDPLQEAERQLDAGEGDAALRGLVANGHAKARVQLANRLWSGRGLPRDASAAEALLREGAESGEPLAMLVLGQRLLYGMGLAADVAAAEPWLERGAEAGFAPAMEAWGSHLLDTGREGLGWLRRAAEAGDVAAQARLGSELAGSEGLDWLRRAAERGFGRAMVGLGERLLPGDEGLAWLTRALDRREPRAGLVLGLARYEARDFAGAVQAFEAALALGAAGARLNLAYMARRNEWPAGVPKPDLATLLAPLAEQEDAMALVNLALAAPDPAEADRLMARAAATRPDTGWWERLAAQGDPEGARVISWLERHANGG